MAEALIHDQLLARVEQIGSGEASLTMQDLCTLFRRQAQLDASEDHPELLPGFIIEITPRERLHIYAPYMISNLENPNIREEVTIEGFAGNNEEGVLVDEIGLDITPTSKRSRVLEAFGRSETEGLDLSHFVKSILEDALEGSVDISRMGLVDDRLVIIIEKSVK